MGLGMALNLSKKIENLTVFDTNTNALEEIQKRNSKIKVAQNLADIKENDIVITMLPNTEIVQNIYAEIWGQNSNCKIAIDCSTVHPSCSKKLNEIATKKSITFIDAPVSGGIFYC